MGVFSQQQVPTHPRHKRSSKIYPIETVLLYGEFVTVSVFVKLWSVHGVFLSALDTGARAADFTVFIKKSFKMIYNISR